VKRTVAIDPVGTRATCGVDCPRFLEKWEPWWLAQAQEPVALLRTEGYAGAVRQKTRNMINKAGRLYTFGEFDYNDQLAGIYSVNLSKAERQGQRMSERYRRPPDPIVLADRTCPLHRSSWWGAWDKDGELAGYVNLVILNDVGVVNTILGHADAPAVINGLFAHLAEHAGVEWIHYLTLRNSRPSLATFKRNCGFAEYDASGASPAPAAPPRVVARAFSLADLDTLEEFVLGHARTVTFSEFAAGDNDPNAVAIRHDVDHDAEHALRFARWEAERGIRASYYLLPTAPYWDSDARRCGLAIAELGHEVGVHNDALAYCEGDAGRALVQLRAWVEEMRSWGLDVRGMADHGGSGWNNTDLWRVLDYTPADVGLDYEAYLLHRLGTNYISDNRGTWRAPLARQPDRQAHLLVHPCHWPVDRVPLRARERSAA